jgi:acyl-CoA reductase-like NAD-dependent aldehyde dehydrogenase
MPVFYDREIFGPVLAIVPVDSIDEAFKIVRQQCVCLTFWIGSRSI